MGKSLNRYFQNLMKEKIGSGHYQQKNASEVPPDTCQQTPKSQAIANAVTSVETAHCYKHPWHTITEGFLQVSQEVNNRATNDTQSHSRLLCGQEVEWACQRPLHAHGHCELFTIASIQEQPKCPPVWILSHLAGNDLLPGKETPTITSR